MRWLMAMGALCNLLIGGMVFPFSPLNIIPVAASAPGAAGTNWKTDVTVYNPGESDVTSYFYLIRQGQTETSLPEATFPIPAHSTREVQDVLQSLYQTTGAGGLLVMSMSLEDYVSHGIEGPDLLVTSRTYNDQGEAGTYGQAIHGIPLPTMKKAALTGIANTARYRTNIGVLNLMGLVEFTESTQVLARIYDQNGGLIHSVEFDLPPFGQLQVPLGTTLDVGHVEFEAQGTFAEITLFAAYASRVDNLTGDAVYIPAVQEPPQDGQALGFRTLRGK